MAGVKTWFMVATVAILCGVVSGCGDDAESAAPPATVRSAEQAAAAKTFCNEMTTLVNARSDAHRALRLYESDSITYSEMKSAAQAGIDAYRSAPTIPEQDWIPSEIAADVETMYKVAPDTPSISEGEARASAAVAIDEFVAAECGLRFDAEFWMTSVRDDGFG